MHIWCSRACLATKATQNVQHFPEEVGCGTNSAFVQNSTRDRTCRMQADHAPVASGSAPTSAESCPPEMTTRRSTSNLSEVPYLCLYRPWKW